jgi:protein-S-isoprenylcysteine O-methyltransferase Ste14
MPHGNTDQNSTGRAATFRIDASAWVSGLSYSTGFVFAGPAKINAAVSSDWTVVPVLALAFAAFLASVLAIQRHMRLSVLASTFGAPKRLVTSGVFQYSRNPIYVAFFGPLASLAIISIPAVIAATATYVLAMNAIVIRKEERDLSAAFGQDFADYLASTPRWLF